MRGATRSTFYPVAREVLTFGYIRLSADNDGKMSSPRTQLTAIERVADKFDLPMPPSERIYTDRDLSASDPTVVRFAYERMLKALDEIDPKRYEVVVLAYNADRVFRLPSDWQIFTALLGADLDGRLITDWENEFDLGPMGIFPLGAGYVEASKTSKRSRDGVVTAAEDGKGHGPVGYGWTRNYDHSGTGKPVSTTVIVPEEAKVIKDAADRILSGDTLKMVCDDLNRLGVASPGAGRVLRRDPDTREALTFANDEWEPQKLRQILLRKSNVAIRSHTYGKRARKRTDESPAQWPAILDDDVYTLLSTKLQDPARRTITSNAVKYLLSGIAICDVCEKEVSGQSTQSGPTGRPRRHYKAYKCYKAHVVKAMQQTDELVVSEVLHVLTQPEVRASLIPPPDSEATDALGREAALLTRKEVAADDYAEGRIDHVTLARVTSSITRQLEEIRNTLARKQDVTVYSILLAADPDRIEDVWNSLGLARQRSIIKALFTVRLTPTTHRGKKAFDPTTVIINLRPMKG